jgi:hypothetical protein
VSRLLTFHNDPIVKAHAEQQWLARDFIFGIPCLFKNFGKGWLVADETVLNRLYELVLSGAW